jgi:hypothetical protein
MFARLHPYSYSQIEIYEIILGRYIYLWNCQVSYRHGKNTGALIGHHCIKLQPFVDLKVTMTIFDVFMFLFVQTT